MAAEEEGIRYRYSRKVLLALRHSPLAKKPSGLPSIESLTSSNLAHKGEGEGKSRGNYQRNGDAQQSGDDGLLAKPLTPRSEKNMVFGPPKMSFASSQQGTKSSEEADAKPVVPLKPGSEFPRPPKYSVADRMAAKQAGAGYTSSRTSREAVSGDSELPRRTQGAEKFDKAADRDRGGEREKGGSERTSERGVERGGDRGERTNERVTRNVGDRSAAARENGQRGTMREERGANPVAVPRGRSDGHGSWRDEGHSKPRTGSPTTDARLASAYADRNDHRGDNRRKREHQPEWMSFDGKSKDETGSSGATSNGPAPAYGDDDIQRFKARMREQEKGATTASQQNAAKPREPQRRATVDSAAALQQAQETPQHSDEQQSASRPRATSDHVTAKLSEIDLLFGPGGLGVDKGLSMEPSEFTKHLFDDVDSPTSPATARPAGPPRKGSEASRSQSRFMRIFEEQQSQHAKLQDAPDDAISRFLGGADFTNGRGQQPVRQTNASLGTEIDLQQLLGSGMRGGRRPSNGQGTSGPSPTVRMPSEEDIIRSMGIAPPKQKMMSEDEVLQALGAKRPTAQATSSQPRDEKDSFGRILNMLARGPDALPAPPPAVTDPMIPPMPHSLNRPIRHDSHPHHQNHIPIAPLSQHRHHHQRMGPDPQEQASLHHHPQQNPAFRPPPPSHYRSNLDMSDDPLAAMVQNSINAKKHHGSSENLAIFKQLESGGLPMGDIKGPQNMMYPPPFVGRSMDGGRPMMNPNMMSMPPPPGGPYVPHSGPPGPMPGQPFLPPHLMQPGMPPPHMNPNLPQPVMLPPFHGPIPPFGMPMPGPGMGGLPDGLFINPAGMPLKPLSLDDMEKS
ncbi:hypothetical protein HK104_000161 [Borealophlyctis nickersoniae]|nr:hypothetical protein HK104_000161 [Borealophlyctis nickersoniae]